MTDMPGIKLDTLLDLFPLMEGLGDTGAVRWDNGYRTFTLTYRELLQSIGGCARHLNDLGLHQRDRILIRGENRPEWVISFWAALARGLQVVPIDVGTSHQLAEEIRRETSPRLLICSEEPAEWVREIPVLTFHQIHRLPPAGEINPVQASPEDIVEIVFTSGTTGKPRGVVHTHRNLCSDLGPVIRETGTFIQYLRYLRPVRILTMLPFSHMFGQALGLFLPVVLQGAVVLTSELKPDRLIELIRREKVLALVTVPRFLTNLREAVDSRHECASRIKESPGVWGFLRRWIRFRDVHLRFGWRFLAIVSGGALLRPSLEHWWSQLGFLVIQGYGLTEASPVVAMNNPARRRAGSLGKVLEGQEIKIAADGEILVKGDNVARYYGYPEREEANQWLHTGDIGRIDEEGNLYFLGRKKDVIVTPEGWNVYPEDIEARIEELPEIAGCAVIGMETSKGTEVHAVLLPFRSETNREELIRNVNRELEPHQKIRSWSLWPERDFPRTSSTGKVRRGLVAAFINRNGPEAKTTPSGPGEGSASSLERIVAEFTSITPASIKDEDRLAEDLGISSLDRIEMQARIEADLGLNLNEDLFASVATWGDIRRVCQFGIESRADPNRKPGGEPLTKTSSGSGEEKDSPSRLNDRFQPPPCLSNKGGKALMNLPRRNPRARLRLPPGINSFPARITRLVIRMLIIIPFARIYLLLRVKGRENLEGLKPPIILASNHVSHLDTLAVISALPRDWRERPAPAMLQDYFLPLLEPWRFSMRIRIAARLAYLTACYLFKAYPFPQKTGGLRDALRLTGTLVDRGDCPLIFPEGRRTGNGRINDFFPGIGLAARKLDLPVVPVRIRGLYRVLPQHFRFPRPGRVSVSFGRPLTWSPNLDDTAFARQLRRNIEEL